MNVPVNARKSKHLRYAYANTQYGYRCIMYKLLSHILGRNER